MFTYDVVNRATGSLENHAAPVYFYLGVLGRSVSSIFLILLSLFGLALLLRSNAFRQRSAPFYDALVCVLAVLVPFVLFSAASSKLFWYILCVYPAIVLLSALAVHQAKHRLPSAAWPKLLLTLSLGLVVCFSAHNVWRYAVEPSRSVTGLSLLLADCSTPSEGTLLYRRRKMAADQADGDRVAHRCHPPVTTVGWRPSPPTAALI